MSGSITKCNFECRSNCSHLKKPSIPEAVVSVEQNPEVSALFANFLQEKAKATGRFGIRDKWQCHAQKRCIQFINANGIKAHLKAILQMGIIGLLHYRKVSKLTPEQRDLLRKELKFYRRCLRVQELYQRCKNPRATAENFKDFKKAYEAVLALADGQVEQADDINDILDNHFANGSSVGAAVLEHVIAQQLTSNKGSVVQNIVDSIHGEEFLTKLSEVHDGGYRCRMNGKEKAFINMLLGSGIVKDKKIREVLNNERTAQIFLACGRVCAKMLANQPGSEDILSDRDIGELLDGQFDRVMSRDNQLILAFIQGKSEDTNIKCLKFLPGGEDSLVGMRKMYAEHQSKLKLLQECTLRLSHLESDLVRLKEQELAEQDQSKQYILEDLEELLRGITNPRQNAGELALREQVQNKLLERDTLQQKLQDQEQSVVQKKKELVKKVETLDARRRQLVSTIATMTTAAKKLQQEVVVAGRLDNNHTAAMEKLAENKEMWDLVESLENSKGPLEQELAQARVELQGFEETALDKDALVVARDDIAAKLVDVCTVSLTHAEIAEIYDKVLVGDESNTTIQFGVIAQRIKRLSEDNAACTVSIDKEKHVKTAIEKGMQESIKKLVDFGFEINEEMELTDEDFSCVKVNCKAYFQDLQAKAPMNAKIISALQAVTLTKQKVEETVLFMGGDPEELDTMRDAYAEYQSKLQLLQTSTLRLSDLESNAVAIKARGTKELDQVKKYTLKELEGIANLSDDTGALKQLDLDELAAFLDTSGQDAELSIIDEIEQRLLQRDLLQKQLLAQESLVEQRKKELAGQVEALDTQRRGLVNSIAFATAGIKQAEQEVVKSIKVSRLHNSHAETKNKVVEHEDICDLITNLAGEKKQVEQELAQVRERLQGFEETAKNKDVLVLARDEIAAKLAEVRTMSLTLTHAQITDIDNNVRNTSSISEQFSTIARGVRSLTAEMEQCAESIEQAAAATREIEAEVQEALGRLTDLGFKTNNEKKLTKMSKKYTEDQSNFKFLQECKLRLFHLESKGIEIVGKQLEELAQSKEYRLEELRGITTNDPTEKNTSSQLELVLSLMSDEEGVSATMRIQRRLLQQELLQRRLQAQEELVAQKKEELVTRVAALDTRRQQLVGAIALTVPGARLARQEATTAWRVDRESAKTKQLVAWDEKIHGDIVELEGEKGRVEQDLAQAREQLEGFEEAAPNKDELVVIRDKIAAELAEVGTISLTHAEITELAGIGDKIGNRSAISKQFSEIARRVRGLESEERSCALLIQKVTENQEKLEKTLAALLDQDEADASKIIGDPVKDSTKSKPSSKEEEFEEEVDEKSMEASDRAEVQITSNGILPEEVRTTFRPSSNYWYKDGVSV